MRIRALICLTVTLTISLVYPLISEGQVDMQFHEGWNLVSLPLNPDNVTLTNITALALSHFRSVWTYNAFSGEWEYYVVGGPQNVINYTSIKPGRAYWIDIDQDALLTITGEEPGNRAVYLWQGLNMVGYDSSTERDIEEDSFSESGMSHSIWTYDNNPTGNWLVYSPDAPGFADKLESLYPGEGYWICVDEDCLWDPFLGSPRVHDIDDVVEAYNLIQGNQNNPDFVILDVRTPGEFSSGHIENAFNIDRLSESFSDDVDKLDKNKTYLIYCHSGARSGSALDIMEGFNYVEVYDMRGGITAWMDQGYPTTTD